MMFFKLSLKNIKQSLRNYTIYFITLIVGISIFYTFNAMDSQTAILSLSKSRRDLIKSMMQMLSVISVLVSIILGYLIIYANNFLIRRRKKEFGLYQTLGMSKRKIAQLLLSETLIVGVISMVVGLFVGIFLSQGMSVLIIHMFEADMSKFQFSFSAEAAMKTGIYFAIIYLLVMIFNVFTVSRYKLITLLNASKKNEVLKTKSNLANMLLFIASLICIGSAYYLLRGRHVLFSSINESVIMLILGAVGTYLLISSIAGFLLKVVQARKKTYYKNLNMFVLRQVNSRVNTMKLSITIISLMLLLTIGIMSSALSLVSAMNTDINESNLCDITLVGNKNKDIDIMKQLKKDGFDTSKYFKENLSLMVYQTTKREEAMDIFLGEKNVASINEKFGTMADIDGEPLYLIKESDYNKLMKFYGKDTIDLKGTTYGFIANFEELLTYYQDVLNSRRTIKIGDTTFTPNSTECIDVPTQNSNMKSEMGMIILPDATFENNPEHFKVYENRVFANFVAGDTEAIETDYYNDLRDFYKKDKDKKAPYTVSFSRIEMANAKIGSTAMITFLGLYLGIIFSITSAAILAIGQLSESVDNKERYAVLRKIGVDDRMINSSLLLQIAIYFILPLLIAIVHSIVGLREMVRLIRIFGNMQLDKNIVITALFIIIVYGAYFTATYIGSKGIIKEKEKYVG